MGEFIICKACLCSQLRSESNNNQQPIVHACSLTAFPSWRPLKPDIWNILILWPPLLTWSPLWSLPSRSICTHWTIWFVMPLRTRPNCFGHIAEEGGHRDRCFAFCPGKFYFLALDNCPKSIPNSMNWQCISSRAWISPEEEISLNHRITSSLPWSYFAKQLGKKREKLEDWSTCLGRRQGRSIVLCECSTNVNVEDFWCYIET